MPDPAIDFLAVLRILARHGVDFIVVGGVGAVLQGAPLTTFDLDVVHARTQENVGRLLAALQELDAWYREHPTRRLRPDSTYLLSPGHQLLMTSHGPLDLLGTVERDRAYEDLLGEAREWPLEEGFRVRVLDLAALVRLKEETARDKDRAVLPVLRRALEERDRRGS
jgi:hypothetical protein